MNDKNGNGIPLGLGMALMRNADAFFYFSALSAEKQQEIIDGTKNIKSKEEMRSYVDRLSSFD